MFDCNDWHVFHVINTVFRKTKFPGDSHAAGACESLRCEKEVNWALAYVALQSPKSVSYCMASILSAAKLLKCYNFGVQHSRSLIYTACWVPCFFFFLVSAFHSHLRRDCVDDGPTHPSLSSRKRRPAVIPWRVYFLGTSLISAIAINRYRSHTFACTMASLRQISVFAWQSEPDTLLGPFTSQLNNKWVRVWQTYHLRQFAVERYICRGKMTSDICDFSLRFAIVSLTKRVRRCNALDAKREATYFL